MHKYKVYKHTNKLNNKVYIGITSKPVIQRWGKNGQNYKQCLRFYKAIQKYGWDNFEHEILFDDLTEKEACKKETELIKEYKSTEYDFGYNCTTSGETNHHIEETKKKLSELRKGKNNPNYGKYGELNSFYGKKHSLESRLSMSKNNWSKKHTGDLSPNAHSVIHLPTLKVFKSVKSCSEFFEVDRHYVTKSVKGRLENQEFMYYEDYERLNNNAKGVTNELSQN